jgi:hypothetical protein
MVVRDDDADWSGWHWPRLPGDWWQRAACLHVPIAYEIRMVTASRRVANVSQSRAPRPTRFVIRPKPATVPAVETSSGSSEARSIGPLAYAAGPLQGAVVRQSFDFNNLQGAKRRTRSGHQWCLATCRLGGPAFGPAGPSGIKRSVGDVDRRTIADGPSVRHIGLERLWEIRPCWVLRKNGRLRHRGHGRPEA